MIIKKIINNNIIQSQNENGQEIIVMGCGLGFKKKSGEIVDESKIEKIYTINDNNARKQLEEILSQVPLECIQITNEIVDYGKISLGKPIKDSIYLTLCDHISFAIERSKEGIEIKNPLLLEIKRFYNGEYQIGEEALEIVYRNTGIRLPEDEAGFIALHFANASLDLDGIDQTREMMSIIRHIVNIVKYHYNIKLDENSIHYDRFITHLKFFVKRIFLNKEIDDGDSSFFTIIKNQYKEAYTCVLKVYEYILKEYDIKLTNDEMMFLTIHIHRITKK